MDRKLLAISIGIAIAAAFVVIPSFNVQAQVSGESKILKVILGLTEQAKSKINDNIIPTVDTVQEDLQFKQKFWQYEPFTLTSGSFVGVQVKSCNLPDKTACAFNVESIQLRNSGAIVEKIFVDGTEITVNQPTPTNLLVDTGIGTIGASDRVSINFSPGNYDGDVEFNGEKPQGMQLEVLCDHGSNPRFCPT